MEAFEKLARNLVTEVPVAKLQAILERKNEGVVRTGVVCGGGCPTSGHTGALCGWNCKPKFGAPDVIDLQGDSGVTAYDLTEVRADLPKLRRAVVHQLEVYLNQFK
jgi:hypothetical protein